MRLRVPLVVVVLNLLALAWIWWISDLMRQSQVMGSVIALGLSSLILFIWFVFFSGAPRNMRFGVALVALSVVGISAALFRIRGVTGDLIPIIEYRFASERALPEARPRPAQPTSTPEAPQISPAPGADEAEATDPSPSPTASPGFGDPAEPVQEIAAITDQNWPQYLGPARSGIVEVKLDTDWAARPPKLLWRQPVGAGWGGFAVSAGIAVTQEQRGDEERVIAYNLRTGEPLWSHADKALHDSPLGGIGPRAVPSIDAGQVFALGATGELNALDLRTGKLLWKRNILKDNGSEVPEWGVAISPLVHGGRVIVSAGGKPAKALVAYDRHTGEPAWAAGDATLAYSSPALMTLAGREQVVMLNQESAAGHDALTGALLWSHEVPKGAPRAAQPIPLSANRVLFSIGYGIGSRVFEISPSPDASLSPKMIWATPRLKSKFANMIAYEGSVYGLDDGVFVCIDPETGERRWKEGRFGHGQMILAGKHILLQTEQGEILLIEPNRERLIEVARFRVLDGKTWNPPALASPVLLVRNDLEAAAYELPVVP